MSLTLEPVAVSRDFLFCDEDLIFLSTNQNEDIAALSLKIKSTLRQKELMQQIARRQKVQTKLPLFCSVTGVYFPPDISLEQCSSEVTAQFKSTLFTGHSLIDLTAGMGLDTLFLSKNFESSVLIEPNVALADITSHNLALLSKKDIKIAKGITAADFLEQYSQQNDLIFVDPSRRSNTGGKVFRLQDCEPDIVALLPQMMAISNRVLIKLSPLLDITLACKALQHVKNVYVISHQHECKELLIEIEKGYTADYQIHAVDLDRGQQVTFNSLSEKLLPVSYELPQQFLYEPNPSLLKAGAFNTITRQYPVKKLHMHSHLYTSKDPVADFPGRIFEISGTIKPSKKEIQQMIPGKKANLTVRNFPATVAQLRKNWLLAEGGTQYLFATTLCNEDKVVLVTQKFNTVEMLPVLNHTD